jgi:hypothetical protein
LPPHVIISGIAVIELIVGKGFTVIVLVAVLVQPVDVLVPTTVYVVVTDGLTVIVVPLNAPGFQVYVFAPVPVSVVEKPAQIVVTFAVVAVLGNAFMVITRVELDAHPCVDVPVTV